MLRAYTRLARVLFPARRAAPEREDDFDGRAAARLVFDEKRAGKSLHEREPPAVFLTARRLGSRYIKSAAAVLDDELGFGTLPACPNSNRSGRMPDHVGEQFADDEFGCPEVGIGACVSLEKTRDLPPRRRVRRPRGC